MSVRAPAKSPASAPAHVDRFALKTETLHQSIQDKHVAELNIDPDALKPIKWMNEKHFDNLKAGNALSPGLLEKIESHRAKNPV